MLKTAITVPTLSYDSTEENKYRCESDNIIYLKWLIILSIVVYVMHRIPDFSVFQTKSKYMLSDATHAHVPYCTFAGNLYINSSITCLDRIVSMISVG